MPVSKQPHTLVPVLVEIAGPSPSPVAIEGAPKVAVGSTITKEQARAHGSKGGIAKRDKARLLQGLGLADLTDADRFKPYWTAVEGWTKTMLQALAAECGGYVGPGPASILGTAGVQLAVSRYFSDLGVKNGDSKMFDMAARHGNWSRDNVLAARKLALSEAALRKGEVNAFETLLAAMQTQDDDEK